MLRLEKALDDCLDQLKTQCQTFHPEADIDMSETDELDSIASGSLQAGGVHTSSLRHRVVRFSGSSSGASHAEMERLRTKINKLESENMSLRQEVNELRILLGQEMIEDKTTSSNNNGEEKNASNDDGDDVDEERKVELSEAGVWNLVRQLNFDGKSAKLL